MRALESIVAAVTVIGRCAVIAQMPYSRTQVYGWGHEIRDRKAREPKHVDQHSAEMAVALILTFPYLSAAKAQAYMIYHRLGLVSQHFYKQMKKKVRRVLFQEASRRGLLPERTRYTHVRAREPHQIWAEDFTALPLQRHHFSLAVVVDVCTGSYLGVSVHRRAANALVQEPLDQALAQVPDGPRDFVLSDNGAQYISARHEEALDVAGIVHKRIPACRPQYNGSAECGIKEFKQLFYCLWPFLGQPISADEKEQLHLRVQRVAELTRVTMNQCMPRPPLGGVTPNDRIDNTHTQKMKANQQYREERSRKEALPWNKTAWEMVQDITKQTELTNLELMTNFCFFLKRSLRKLAELHKGVLGNFDAVFSGLS